MQVVNLADWLRRVRRERKHKQADVAAEVGVDQSTISKWERGERPKPEHIPTLAEYLDADEDAVLRAAYLNPSERLGEGGLAERVEALEASLQMINDRLGQLLTAVDGLGPAAGGSQPRPQAKRVAR